MNISFLDTLKGNKTQHPVCTIDATILENEDGDSFEKNAQQSETNSLDRSMESSSRYQSERLLSTIHSSSRMDSTSSNKGSFLSAVNSFIGFFMLNRSQYQGFIPVGVKNNNSILSKPSEYTEHQRTLTEAIAEGESSTGLPIQKRLDDFDGARESDPAFREGVDDKKDQKLHTKKVDNNLQKSAKPKTKADPSTLFKGPVPACYVICKDRDTVFRSVQYSSSTNGSSNSAKCSGRLYNCAYAINACDKLLNMGTTADVHGESNGGKRDFLTRLRMFFLKRKMVMFSSKGDGITPTTTIINKGASNMLILKIQSDCKNYLDVNPDFGWRRLVQQSPKSRNPTQESGSNASGVYDAQRSYMFYRETKNTTHAIGLCELAINIACRTLILSVIHGFLDVSSLPPHLQLLLPPGSTSASRSSASSSIGEEYGKHGSISHLGSCSNGSSSGVKSQSSNVSLCYDSMDNKGYCYAPIPFQKNLFLKSSFVGLFVTPSVHANLSSDMYIDRMKDVKRRFIWRVSRNPPLEAVDYISTHIPIPDYGWKLVKRPYYDRNYRNFQSSSTESQGRLKNTVKRIFNRISPNDTNISFYPISLLCKVRPPQHHNPTCNVYADVGSIAMNISEQLYRLESSIPTREKAPRNTFGYILNGSNMALGPDGREYKIIPEELILNTASLVHEMYITQACIVI
ncbi:hypothetical protein BdWA1_002966 [Babesia duncani]|uniref:Uncharacterized protein n=1 Tax=Babesia duncani TaxID=323732 RepID=A0AAD9UMQ7_9APIC|nr:hypothetical protein BdWA1_002966 [Babesia duncani]